MSVWKEYRLKELLILEYGKSLKNYRNGIGQYEVFGTNGKIGLTTNYLYSEPSIIIGRKGAYREVHYTKNPFYVIDTAFYTRKRDVPIDTLYMYYWFKNVDINAMDSGSAIPSTNRDEVYELIVNLPDLPTQKAIAEILSSLDDKIELNNKINQELEALAQTLFKRWFVDFEFPNENRDPYKSSGGEMMDSELGEIPKGWEVKKLEDISNITIGRTPPRQEYHWFTGSSNDVKWISIRDMGNCGAYILNTSEFLTEEAVSRFKIPVIDKNTLIISFKLTVGRVAITTDRMLSNEAIAQINLFDKKTGPEFFYLYLKQFDFDTLGSTSSIATAVNSKAIKALKFINPLRIVFESFQSQISPIFQNILSNTYEIQQLTNLRDTLLPKLISGELEVL